jgi:lipopolysaccharide transport system ATP-binding protein
MTGRENIYLNGAILGMRKWEIDKKFDEIVDFAGVEAYIDTPVKRYSSGMYVRLAFAVAAYLEPEILIVDEVLAVGDAEFQKKCLGRMKDVSENDGRSVLFVSHNMMAVRNICQSGMVLKEGSISYFGNVDNAVDSYLREYSDVNHNLRFNIEDAPSNSEAKLLRAEVVPLLGREWPIFEGEGFIFYFDFFYTGANDTNLDVTFHLVDEFGNLVFVGSSTFTNETLCFNQGLIKSTCIIPSEFMHHGVFSVSKLLLVRNRGSIVFEYFDVISFELIPAIIESFGWMGKKEGIIKPKLHWKLESDTCN